MISQTAEYALRAVVCIAAHAGAPVPTNRVAEDTQVPLDYLYKVLLTLSRAGLVVSSRGVRGGYQLNGDAQHITVLDVVNSVDPIRRIDHCPLGLTRHRRQLCPMHKRVDDAIAKVRQALADSTIAGIVAESLQEAPFCERHSDAGRRTKRRNPQRKK